MEEGRLIATTWKTAARRFRAGGAVARVAEQVVTGQAIVIEGSKIVASRGWRARVRH